MLDKKGDIMWFHPWANTPGFQGACFMMAAGMLLMDVRNHKWYQEAMSEKEQ